MLDKTIWKKSYITKCRLLRSSCRSFGSLVFFCLDKMRNLFVSFEMTLLEDSSDRLSFTNSNIIIPYQFGKVTMVIRVHSSSFIRLAVNMLIQLKMSVFSDFVTIY